MANWKDVYNSVNNATKKKKKDDEEFVHIKKSDLSSKTRKFLDDIVSSDGYKERQRLKEIENNLLNSPEFAETKKAEQKLYMTAMTQALASQKKAEREAKEQEKALKDQRSYFKNAGLFDDGWQFGDVFKTGVATLQDAHEEIVEGGWRLGEQAIDVGAYLLGAGADLFGADDFRDSMSEFIAKDLINEEYLVKNYNPFFRFGAANLLGVDVEDASILGGKTEGLANSGGQLAVQYGLQAVGVPWWVTSGVGSFGGTTEEQLKEARENASARAAFLGEDAANAYDGSSDYWKAGGIAAFTAGTEIATEKLFGDSILGEKGLIDMGGLTNGISNKALKLGADYGLTLFTNAGEEWASEGISTAGEAAIKGENVWEALTSEEAKERRRDAAIGGAALGGLTNAPKAIKSAKTGTDYNTGLTADEESVVNKEVEKRIAEQEKDGKKLSKNEKSKIFQSVVEAMDEGSLSIDSIEEALGGDTFKTYQDTKASEESTLKEFEELYQGEELEQQIKDLRSNSKLGEIKKQLGSEVFTRVKDSRLGESYREVGRRGQSFQADLSQYDEKQRTTIQKAIDSGILNNTRRTHKFVDWIAQITADKGVLFDFVNNEKLKQSGFAVDGKMVNGYVTKDGDVVLNVQSAKALNTTVGHEISHVLEGTELYDIFATEMKNYASSKKASDSKFANEYMERLYNTRQLYKNVDGYEGVQGHEKIKKEVIADLVGDYLFTDSDFVTNLSAKNRNLFQKIYDEIKYLYKTVTAGSAEAEKLLAVKKAFEDAYRATTNAQKNTTNEGGAKYSIARTSKIPYGIQLQQLEQGKLPSSDSLYIGTPSTQVQSVGLSSNPFAMNQSDYKKSRRVSGNNKHYSSHAVPYEFFESMPQYMADAPMLIDNGNKTTVITSYGMKDTKGNDSYVIGGVWRDADMENGKVNLVKSAYPWDDFATQITRAAESGKLVVTNKNKAEQMLATIGIQPAEVSRILNLAKDSLAQKGEIVNRQFSLSTDNTGKELSAELQDRLQFSQVRDEDGHLKLMYHGTPNGDIAEFKAGTYFTENREYADRYQNTGASSISTGKTVNNPKTFEVYLDIRKPFDLSDPEAKRIYIEDYIKGGNAIGIDPYLSDAEYAKIESIDWTEGEDLRDFLVENGYDYDGLVLDEGADGGYGEDVKHRGKSYVIFSSDQAILADASDVQYSLSEDVTINRDNFYDVQREVNRLTESIREFESSAEWKAQMDKVSEGMANGDTESAIQGYMRFIEESGYNALTSKRNALRDALDKYARKAEEDRVNEAVTLERKAIEESGLSEADYFRKQAVKEFGYTPYFYDAGYIVTNGKMLNFSGEKGKHFGSRGQDHRAIETIYATTERTDALNRFINEGNIRIVPESPGIDVSAATEPTSEQYATIKKFLYQYADKGYFSIDISDNSGKVVGSLEYENRIFPAKVIDDLKHYYKTGEIRQQSSLSSFLSLSAEGENPNAYGNFNTYGNDIALEETLPIHEDVAAPVAETPVAETLAVEDDLPIAETVEDPLPDNLPMADEELDSLVQQKDALEAKMLAMSEKGDFGDEFYQLNNQWVTVTERVKALESEIAERDADRVGSFDDADAPPIAEQYDDSTADIIPITKKLGDDIAREVRAKLGLGNKHMADVRSIIGEYVNSEFPNREQLFEELKDKFGTYKESYTDESLVEAKKYLRTYGLQVGDYIKSEIADYTDVMRKNFGRIRFSKDGSPVDLLYQEMSGMYPHLFPESIDVPTDQFERIVEIANTDSVAEFESALDDEAIYEVADTIINSVNDYRNVQREKAANKYGRDSFDSLMQDADKYVPPVNLDQVLRNRRNPIGTENPDAPAAEIYDTQHKKGVVEGQQAMWNDPVPQVITRKDLHQNIVDDARAKFAEKGLDFEEVLKNAKNLSTFATVDNTPQRVMEKALGYKAGQVLSDITVNKVAQNETEGIKWLNSITDRKSGFLAQLAKQYNIKPGSKESAAAQMYAEGFYVNGKNEMVQYGDAELAQDFRDSKKRANIKALARDPRIRQFYDSTLAMINESRKRNAYPEIPRLDNYFLHFRAMDDTFSRLGLPFNPNDIRAKDLPTDLNGVTADLKPGQPYFASAMHRMGKRTSFDLLGGLERYATSAKNQIYHIDDIQTLRALRNYIADTYGQANGLEGLDALTEEEAQDKIEQVYNSHLSTFAKFLNEEANVLAGKTALIDRGLEGIIGRRGITFLNTINQQVGKNMVGFNVSSSLTNFLPVAQTFAKTNKFDFLKAFAQTSASKISSVFGKENTFAENSPVMIRRRGADSFYRTPWQKVSDAGYVFMSAVDEISTELIARTKYNELTRKGMDTQQAHIETDKWVSRLMGDRSLGQQPQLYNSKMLGLVTKFQLEVRNQLDSQFYDTIQEANVSTEHIQNKLERNAKKAAKITSTFVQLAVAQHLFGKAFESVAGYNPAFDIIDVLIKTFGWDDDEDDEDTVLDNIEEGFLALLGDLPYTSTFTGGRIPIESALPIEQLVTGKDNYGNEVSRWDTIKGAAPYYLLPGGYGQARKTVQGLQMFDDDLPISGSYTDSGNLRFPVEDTFGNRLQAGLFGQYASENARDYFDNERDPLKEKQIQEFIDLDIPIRDYWEYREGLSDKGNLSEKADYIDSLDLPIVKKNLLINNIADRKEPINMWGYDNYGSFEEFDFAKTNPEKYQFLQDRNISWSKYVWNKEEYNYAYNNTEMYDFLQENGVTYKQYKSFDEETKDALVWAKENPGKYALSKAISSDFLTYYGYKKDLANINAKDANGNTVSGLKKQRVFDYIENLDIDYGEKIILYRSVYNSKSDKEMYNADILEYLNSRNDLTYAEKRSILEELDFKVSADGTVTW